MKQKVFLFDVGATLLYPDPPIAQVFERVTQKRGHQISLADIEQHIPVINAYYEDEYARDGDFWCSHEGSVAIWLDQYRYLAHLTGVAHDAEGIAREVHSGYSSASHWALFPDVVACLRGLKHAGFTLGVVSNWDAGLENLLRELHLLPYFDVVISSAVVGYRKPNPVIFKLALESLQVAPDECIHIGDNIDADGNGAHATGITPLIIDRGANVTECPYRRISSLLEILEK